MTTDEGIAGETPRGSRTPAKITDGRLVGAPFFDDPGVRRIFALLDRDGEEARVVGGAVRAALMGESVGEVDFATTALPGVVAARARKEGLRVLPTGIDHGTLTLLVGGSAYEVTTLREDVATDGRRAVVRFGRSFEHDAQRRDFTINALSAAADGRIFDCVGGLADLAQGRLRFIGAPRARIREDYLRSLRFLRFHAQFGRGAPDAEALVAIIAEREGLARLSRERVRGEAMKLLAGRRAADVVGLTSDMGLAQSLFGGLLHPARLAAAMAVEAVRGAAPDALARLAAAAVLIEEDAQRLRERLRLSNAETERLRKAAQALAALHGRDAPPGENALRALIFLNGRRAALDALALAFAESRAEAADRTWGAALNFLREAEDPRLPFSGGDMLARGVAPGRAVGAALKDLQARWIRAGFPRDPAVLARLLDEAASKGPGEND